MKRSAKLVTLLLLVVMVMAVCLTGCAPDTLADAKTKMENKNYATADFDVSILQVLGIKVEGVFVATHKEESEKVVFGLMFADEDTAKAAKEKIEKPFKDKYVAELDKQIKAEKDEDKKQALKDAKAAFNVKVSGKWIAAGNKKAVSDLL